jgi:hypothetical protein
MKEVGEVGNQAMRGWERKKCKSSMRRESW